MILTLKELSEQLKLNERTILRMLKNGQIEGKKVGGQWRFNGKQLDTLFFPGKKNTEEDVPLEELTHTHFGIPLSRLVNENRIFLDMKATTPEEAILELTAPSIFNTMVLDINDLRTKCIEREKLLSTGVGNGVAIPHPRDPIPTLRASGCLVIGRSKAGINFNALDEKPVHLLFLSCAQTIELHLHLMAKLSTLLHHQEFLDIANNGTTATEIIRGIMEVERAEFLNTQKTIDEE